MAHFQIPTTLNISDIKKSELNEFGSCNEGKTQCAKEISEPRKNGFIRASLKRKLTNGKVKAFAVAAWLLQKKQSESIQDETDIKVEEYAIRPWGARRMAICDEIERKVIMCRNSLRILRRNLVVSENLQKWHLL